MSSSRRSRRAPVLGLLVATTLGVTLAWLDLLIDPTRKDLTIVLTLVMAVGLGIIGLFRYQYFVPAALLLRPSLDDLKLDELGVVQPAAVLGLTVIGIVSIRLFVDRQYGVPIVASPVGKAWLAFVVVLTVGLPASMDVGVSYPVLLGLWSSCLLYLSLESSFARDPNALRRVLMALALGAVPPLMTGFAQFFWTGTLEPISGLVRIDGTFTHSNPFGTYLAGLIVVGVASIGAIPERDRGWLGLELVAAAFVMAVTFARAAWFSMILGLLVLSMKVDRRLAFVVIGGAVAAFLFIPGVADRFGNIFADSNPDGTALTDDSLSWRIQYWQEIYPLAFRNPLTGVGLGVVATLTVVGRQPHNSFIQALVEGGLVGFVAWTVLIGTIAYAGWQGWHLASSALAARFDPLHRAFLVGSVAAVVTVILQLFTENVMTDTVLQWFYAVPAAHLAAAVWRRSEMPPELLAPDAAQPGMSKDPMFDPEPPRLPEGVGVNR